MINASLFAHIHNDAFLAGTYRLQGNTFANTIGYLIHYLTTLDPQCLPSRYDLLIQDLSGLQEIEKILSACKLDKEALPLAKKISDDLLTLSLEHSIFLPGGWDDHALIYQFSRVEESFYLKVINSGAGLNYHAKKSSLDKELYNPVKSWSFPIPVSEKEKEELVFFVARLLQAKIAPSTTNVKARTNENILYREILPSISYLGGMETDSTAITPDYAYTSGQLSGTCSQRCLHQLLKINSSSLQEYQRFIFEFKIYSLREYSTDCFSSKQPFNAFVAEQITLAIENSLKILKIPYLFSDDIKRDYFLELKALKEKTKDHAALLLQDIIERPLQDYPSLAIAPTSLAAPAVNLKKPTFSSPFPLVDLPENLCILQRLTQTLHGIKKITDPTVQYVYLEELITSLPLNHSPGALDPSYRSFNRTDWQAFLNSLNAIQDQLEAIKTKWFSTARSPLFEHLMLSLFFLQMDASELSREPTLPSFYPLLRDITRLLLDNRQQDPFVVTNHPRADKRILFLRHHRLSQDHLYEKEFVQYFQKLLATEPELNQALTFRYQQNYGKDRGHSHQFVQTHHLGALYLISLHLNPGKTFALEQEFLPLIGKIENHLNYERRIRRILNQLDDHSEPLAKKNYLELSLFLIQSPVDAHALYHDLSQSMKQHKYNLSPSPAQSALALNCPIRAYRRLNVMSANQIQLNPCSIEPSSNVTFNITQSVIEARHFFHLRVTPLQIALTIDYFTKNLYLLLDSNNQRYLEANLFQSGLLLQALQTNLFLPQFDHLVNLGIQYYVQHDKKGVQHTPNSLFFFRLNLLVSVYYARTGEVGGHRRLKTFYHQLIDQLNSEMVSEVRYVLYQYLFLTAVSLIDHPDQPERLLSQAMTSYFYINTHDNPSILEDNVHRIEVESAAAKFKIFMSKQPLDMVIDKARDTVYGLGILGSARTSAANFPIIHLTTQTNHTFEVDIFQGRVFSQGLCKAGLPLVIRHHPLIKQLGFQEEEFCLINPTRTYLIIQQKYGGVRLFHDHPNLIVRREWVINDQSAYYELQPLTEQHLAKLAAPALRVVGSGLPAILKDKEMDYWKKIDSEEPIGLLVKNGSPTYLICNNRFHLINAEGHTTDTFLSPLTTEERQLFNSFEGNNFILAFQNTTQRYVEMPRFGLRFYVKLDMEGRLKAAHADTQEQVQAKHSPIHASVPGLYLSSTDSERFLIPITRFYAMEEGLVLGGIYPIKHDRAHYIAQSELKDIIDPSAQWIYSGSSSYASYPLINNQLIAETLVEALYLAYLYLATNQAHQAWNTLNLCVQQFGGLTGSQEELVYLKWIMDYLPYYDSDSKEQAVRKTPPVIACQIKALSLLADYLIQGGKITPILLQEKPLTSVNDYFINYHQEALKDFLTDLPKLIDEKLRSLQSMRRHMEKAFHLSTLELKRLLDYYQAHISDTKIVGTMGYEWTQFSVQALLAERQSFSALAQSAFKTKYEAHFKSQFHKLKTVFSRSTQLHTYPINLTLPEFFRWNTRQWRTLSVTRATDHILAKKVLSPELVARALSILNSSIPDEQFIEYFPIYLQLARMKDVRLHQFTTQTLQASQFISLEKQASNIPLLCNLLYRAHHNPECFISTPEPDLSRWFKSFAKPVPNLLGINAEDVYAHVLAEPQQIMDASTPKERHPLSLPSSSQETWLTQMGIEEVLRKSDETLYTALNLLITKYCQVEFQLVEKLNKVDLEGGNLEEEFLQEKEAGEWTLDAEEKKLSIAEQFLSNQNLIFALREITFQALNDIRTRIEDHWEEALTRANRGPTDADEALTWALEQEAKIRQPLTRKDLLTLYVQADYSQTHERTGLNLNDAQQLHHKIHESLILGILQQTLVKIQTSLEHSSSQESGIHHAMMALSLLARHAIPGLDSPVLTLLQHEQQILLHERQMNALENLLAVSEQGEFHCAMEKIIMGGGKSKVILPILAEAKAQGSNLVIIEVPQALFQTNYQDLNRTSQRLFGKKAYRFEFNRHSDVSEMRLQQVYDLFIEVMTNKTYLITTGESMMSLELKYLELLLNAHPSESDNSWENELYWFNKIITLLRENADCVIDEAHLGLSIKKQLNYVGNDKEPLNQEVLDNTVLIYQLIEEIDPSILHAAPQFVPDYDWRDFKQQLAIKLLTSELSPIKLLSEQNDSQEELLLYLLQQTDIEPAIVRHASYEEKKQLAFFKQQINEILPNTLGRRLNEHYGASRRPNLDPLEKTLALPYAGNNIVNEQNRFGNILEALNYTTQMMLLQGISKELLIYCLQQWRSEAKNELFQQPDYQHLDNTPTAQGFVILTQDLGLALSEINIEDEQKLEILHIYFQSNRACINDLLKKQILKLILQEREIISSNALNHSSLYRSIQALSGTPPHQATVSERLLYNRATSLGIDGYTLALIKKKKSSVTPVEGNQESASYISYLLAHAKAPEKTRALIDICAGFKGVSNLEVAQAIACFYRAQTASPIKYVLYFNTEQLLCAIDIDQPALSILLKTSDAHTLASRLKASPNERFTYYDQAHAVGTDIVQANNAHALVLVDKKTSLQNFLQGSWRMRGLALQQTLEFIVPKTWHNASLDSLIEQVSCNQNYTLSEDILITTKMAMANVLRDACVQLILNLSPKEASLAASLFKAQGLLVQQVSTDFYALYGPIQTLQLGQKILDAYYQQLLVCWQRCRESLSTITVQELPEIDKKLRAIIKRASPYCVIEYTTAQVADNMEVEVQTQVQTEVQQELQQENDVIQEVFDPTLKEQPVQHFSYSLGTYYGTSNQQNRYSLTLNQLCQYGKSLSDSWFSLTLRASKNYAFVYQGQISCVNGFLKPVYCIWYHLEKRTLHATIVTPQEVADSLGAVITKSRHPASWIATTLDTVILGNRPQGILQDQEYLSYREQIRFFNGELEILLNQKEPFCWLSENAAKKIAFFEEQLMIYRPKSKRELPLLKSFLLQTNPKGYEYIIQHSFTNLEQVNWLTIVGNATPASVIEYTHAAKAISYINQEWDKATISISQLYTKFNLSINSLVYIKKYLNLIQQASEIIKSIASLNHHQSFINQLIGDKKLFIELILNEPVSSFLTRYSIDETNLSNFNPADFGLLAQLYKHPLFKGRSKIHEQILQVLKRKVNSAQDLITILRLNNLSENTTQWIIDHPHCQQTVLQKLVALRKDISEQRWQLIKRKTSNIKELLDTFLTKPTSEIPAYIVEEAFEQGCLSELNLTAFIQQISFRKEFYYKLFVNSESTTALRQLIGTVPSFSRKELFIYILKFSSDNIELFALAHEFYPLSNQVLIEIKTHIKSDKIIVFILKNITLTNDTLLAFASSDGLTVEMALELIKKEESCPNLWQAVVSKALEKYKNTAQNDEKLAWHVFLRNLCLTGNQKQLETVLEAKGVDDLLFADLLIYCSEQQLSLIVSLQVDYAINRIQMLAEHTQAHYPTLWQAVMTKALNKYKSATQYEEIITWRTLLRNLCLVANQEQLETVLDAKGFDDLLFADLLAHGSEQQLNLLVSLQVDYGINRIRMLAEYTQAHYSTLWRAVMTKALNKYKNASQEEETIAWRTLLRNLCLTANQKQLETVLDAQEFDDLFFADLLTHSSGPRLSLLVSIQVDYGINRIQTLAEHVKAHYPTLLPAVITRALNKYKKATRDNEVIAWRLFLNNYCLQLNENQLETIFEKEGFDTPLFADLLKNSAEHQLGQFISLQANYGLNHIKLLTEHVELPNHIHNLLARPEMNAQQADILFEKPHFNYEVKKEWNWLTEKQLVAIISNTTDFPSLCNALTHNNLSRVGQKNIIDQLIAQQMVKKQEAIDPQGQILAEIESIHLLACKHLLKSTKKTSYYSAAEAAFILYKELHEATKNHFTHNSWTAETYSVFCRDKIAHAGQTLGKHRGVKQILYDVLNVILAILTLNQLKKGNQWRFFTIKTHSVQTVEKATQPIAFLRSP